MLESFTCIHVLIVHMVLFYHVNTQTVYVSKNGMDSNSCGSSPDQPCGTLFFASKLINKNVTELFIDGQNETEIMNYYQQQQSYHPCMPQPFSNTTSELVIYFNDTTTEMKHWYPQICESIGMTNYTNEYMFDFKQVNLTIYNLYINNYDENVGFIRTKYIYNVTRLAIESNNARLTCYNCKFQHLFYSNSKNLPMIYSTTNIKLINSRFYNITALTNNIISMALDDLELINVRVEHCRLDEYFITTTTNTDITETNPEHNNTILVSDCVFDNMWTKKSIINEVHTVSNLIISNANFTNIHSGAIFVGLYLPECFADINNVIISTSQTRNIQSDSYSVCNSDDVYNNLFYFHYSNDVKITNLKVVYNYNVNQHCNFTSPELVIRANVALNSSEPSVMISCKNPVSLIRNVGRINMTSISLRVNITQNYSLDYEFWALKYEESVIANVYASIINGGEMSINHLHVDGLSFGDNFIHNEGLLFINDARFNLRNYFNPNALQSLTLIYQTAPTASINISNSHLIGGYKQIKLNTGILYASNVKFEDTATAIFATSSTGIIIHRCDFNRVGRYFSNLRGLKYGIRGDLTIISFRESSNIIISNNRFSGYDHKGLIYGHGLVDVIIKDNDFTVNITNFYYDVSTSHLQNAVLLGFIDLTMTNVAIIGNNFYPNPIFENTAWINVYLVQACLSANNFSNYALEFWDSDITSCFRPDVIDCFNNVTRCVDGMYGKVDDELFNKSNTFNIYNNDISILNIYSDQHTAYTVLDNININIIDDDVDTESFQALQINNNMLILDSVLTINNDKIKDVDIWYSDECTIRHNDRLINQDNYISKLMIICDKPDWKNLPWSVHNYSNTRNVSKKYVESFSATQLDFKGLSSTYFPGQKLNFTFDILDLFNSRINTSTFFHLDESTIDLENEELSVFQELTIDKMGECAICDHGITIPSISLKDGINNTHKIKLFFDDLFVVNDLIPIETVSCPIRYGADKNGFCHICESGTYNLLSNNDKECLSCNEGETNKGIECREGKIFTEHNYWVGFESKNG
eukprot:402980_1